MEEDERSNMRHDFIQDLADEDTFEQLGRIGNGTDSGNLYRAENSEENLGIDQLALLQEIRAKFRPTENETDRYILYEITKF